MHTNTYQHKHTHTYIYVYTYVADILLKTTQKQAKNIHSVLKKQTNKQTNKQTYIYIDLGYINVKNYLCYIYLIVVFLVHFVKLMRCQYNFFSKGGGLFSPDSLLNLNRNDESDSEDDASVNENENDI